MEMENINSYINSYMITSEKVKLTISICHIDRFSKAEIPMYSPTQGWQKNEKNKEKMKNTSICKALCALGRHKKFHIFLKM